MNSFILVVMIVFVFVIAIVSIVQGASLYREKLKVEANKAKASIDETLGQRLKDMEERIQTLERIATDKKSQLKQTIEEL